MHLRIILLFYRSVSVHPESHKPFHMPQQLSPHDIPAVQIPNLLQTGYMLFFPVVLFFFNVSLSDVVYIVTACAAL